PKKIRGVGIANPSILLLQLDRAHDVPIIVLSMLLKQEHRHIVRTVVRNPVLARAEPNQILRVADKGHRYLVNSWDRPNRRNNGDSRERTKNEEKDEHYSTHADIL